MNHDPDIDKFFIEKDPYEAKYQLLINKRKCTRLKHLSYSKAFTEYSNNLINIYENIEEHNLNKKQKIFIVHLRIWLLKNIWWSDSCSEKYLTKFNHYFVMKITKHNWALTNRI